MQIFAFGHSITQGFWDPEGGWVSILRKELDNRALENEDEYYEVYNLGVSGDDSENLMDRMEDEFIARKWEKDEQTILIQIGANDTIVESGKVRRGPESFRDNLKNILEVADDLAENVILVTDAYTTIEGDISWSEENEEMSDDRLEHYVSIQREVCQELNVEFVDLRESASFERWEEMLEDGVHPNRKGHEFIAERVRPKLLDLI